MFVDLPLGHTVGLPHDVAGQTRILTDGLKLGLSITEPGTVVDLPVRYVDDHWKTEPLAWSRKRQDNGGTRPGGGSGGDTRSGRSDAPAYQSPDDAEAAAAVPWADQCRVCIGLPEG